MKCRHCAPSYLLDIIAGGGDEAECESHYDCPSGIVFHPVFSIDGCSGHVSIENLGRVRVEDQRPDRLAPLVPLERRSAEVGTTLPIVPLGPASPPVQDVPHRDTALSCGSLFKQTSLSDVLASSVDEPRQATTD